MFLKELIPISVPALLNGIKTPVIGCFQEELSAEMVRAARIAVMDVHWYLSLPAAMRLARQLKLWNPDIVTVAGGLTATIFARQIVQSTDIDYVLRGDAEVPLSDLVQVLLNGGSPEKVANLVHRDFSSPWSFHADRKILDGLQYNRFEVFPTFHRRLRALHARRGHRPFPTHPWLMAFRGCPHSCSHCAGSPDQQRILFKRGVVIRSADRLCEELEELSRDRDMHYVNIIHDFVGLLQKDYTERVLSRQYDLKVFYELAGLPEEGALGLLLSAFRGGVINFSVDRFHCTSAELCEVGPLIHRIRQAQADKRFLVRLLYSRKIRRSSVTYDRAVSRIARETKCMLWDGSKYWCSVPGYDTRGDGTDEEYLRYMANRGSRFRIWNTVYRAGLFLHRFAPRTTERIGQLLPFG